MKKKWFLEGYELKGKLDSKYSYLIFWTFVILFPKVVPGRAGMLVTLFLVLANFFSDAQVCIYIKKGYV